MRPLQTDDIVVFTEVGLEHLRSENAELAAMVQSDGGRGRVIYVDKDVVQIGSIHVEGQNSWHIELAAPDLASRLERFFELVEPKPNTTAEEPPPSESEANINRAVSQHIGVCQWIIDRFLNHKKLPVDIEPEAAEAWKGGKPEKRIVLETYEAQLYKAAVRSLRGWIVNNSREFGLTKGDE